MQKRIFFLAFILFTLMGAVVASQAKLAGQAELNIVGFTYTPMEKALPQVASAAIYENYNKDSTFDFTEHIMEENLGAGTISEDDNSISLRVKQELAPDDDVLATGFDYNSFFDVNVDGVASTSFANFTTLILPTKVALNNGTSASVFDALESDPSIFSSGTNITRTTTEFKISYVKSNLPVETINFTVVYYLNGVLKSFWMESAEGSGSLFKHHTIVNNGYTFTDKVDTIDPAFTYQQILGRLDSFAYSNKLTTGQKAVYKVLEKKGEAPPRYKALNIPSTDTTLTIEVAATPGSETHMAENADKYFKVTTDTKSFNISTDFQDYFLQFVVPVDVVYNGTSYNFFTFADSDLGRQLIGGNETIDIHARDKVFGNQTGNVGELSWRKVENNIETTFTGFYIVETGMLLQMQYSTHDATTVSDALTSFLAELDETVSTIDLYNIDMNQLRDSDASQSSGQNPLPFSVMYIFGLFVLIPINRKLRR